ncbi:DUF1015 family protein [Actinopolyspora halophila]|uniref:DUF1015 family protein n=1 Tax=Actinopolyspora halophila TaxID=1850 RepID=UPI0003613F06|nr:DUF1015 family protein [Actinopolyspora halophila]
MKIPQKQRTVTETERGHTTTGGVTVRSPRVLVVNQQRIDSLDGSMDPARVRRLLDTGGYTRPMLPAVIVYRLRTGRHQQTGVVLEVSLDDYRNGLVRRHEATHPDREQRIAELTEAGGAEQMPVILTYPDRPALDTLLEGVTEQSPDVRANSVGDVEHSLWIRRDAELSRVLGDELGGVESLYIADGHHRMAVAERDARTHGRPGDETRAFTLAALFPSSQMRVLGYHRCLPGPWNHSTTEVLQTLAAQPAVAHIEECPTDSPNNPAPGMVLLRLHDQCFRLWLRPPRADAPVRATLDAVLLDEQLLPPVTRLVGPVEEQPPDSAGTKCWCAARNAMCFVPHPPSVEQVMAVSDAGALMPPKSTWFDPKAVSGLFVRELS